MQALLQQFPQQRSAVVYLTSLTLTAFNRGRDTFSDADELKAMEALARWLVDT